MNPDLLSVALRVLGFISLFQAVGAAIFVCLFHVRMPHSGALVRKIGCSAAMIGIVLLVAHQQMEGARMAADFSGLFDPRLQALAWRGNSGIQVLLQVLALSAIAIGLAQRTAARTLAVIGTALIAGAAILSGHTSVHAQRALLAPLLALHVLLGCFWFGALLPLIVCSRRETHDDAVSILNAFSNVAGPLVPCIGLAGLVMAQTLLPETAQWRTPYAALLLTKMAVFVVLLGFAAWNRWRGVPAIGGADTAAASRRLRRSIAIEYGLMLAVLGVTGVMTTFYAP
jgi:putative copper resistance protein D